MDDSHPLDYYPEDDTGDDMADSLALIDRARSALAQAENLADIGAVREIAERARRYASAAKLGRAAENHAARLRLEAERKAGAMLLEGPKNPGTRTTTGGVIIPPPLDTPKLADLGVSKQQAKDWQRIARVPDEVFEAHVEQAQRKGEALTTAGVVQVARQIERRARADQPKPVIEPATVPARIEVADARSLPLHDGIVDLIVTSPPYAIEVEYEGGDVNPAVWQAFLYIALREALRVTKSSGRLALNVPLDTARGGLRPTYAEAVMAALRAGWAYRSTVVWHDGQTTKGGWALGSQGSSSRPYHVSQVEMVALFSNGEWAPSSDNQDDITPGQFLEAGRGPWAFPGESHAWEGHPAAFPIELPRRLIRYLCRVGDVVLDPFCGSGTTPLAALQLGRLAIGFDRSQQYVDSTLRRLAADRERSRAVGTSSSRAGVPGPGTETSEPGGLRSGLDRGAGSAPEQERIPAGAAGVAV